MLTILILFSFFVEFEERYDPRFPVLLYSYLEKLSANSIIEPLPSWKPLSYWEVLNLLKGINLKGLNLEERRYIKGLKRRLKSYLKPHWRINLQIEGRGYDVLRGETGYEFYPGILFEGEARLGKYLYGVERVELFRRIRDIPDDLPFFDPLQDPSNRLYTFDPYPVIGENEIFEVRMERAFAVLTLPFGYLEVGRNELRWGPGYRSSLLLSGYSLPLDMIYHIGVKAGSFQFMTLNASLPDTIEKRRLSLQRLEFRYGRLRLGVSEGVMYTREDPFKYFNPVGLYYIIQRRGKDNDDNLFASIDLAYYTGKGMKIYGEFLDDDVIITRSAKTPSKYGILTGLLWTNPLNLPIDFRLEGVYMTTWSISHISGVNHLSLNGFPIGFWGGPDCINIFAEISYFPSPVRGIRFSYEYLGHGEKTTETPWVRGEDYKLRAPSGIVDRRNTFRLTLMENSFLGNFCIDLSLSFIRNYSNIEGRDFTRLSLRYYFGSAPLSLRFPLVD
jgi:hypothetical protein